jgi:Xaa-Pro aminopeptidase
MDQLRAVARAQAARFARVAQAMHAIDPDMYQQDIAALVRAARKLGGEDQS